MSTFDKTLCALFLVAFVTLNVPAVPLEFAIVLFGALAVVVTHRPTTKPGR